LAEYVGSRYGDPLSTYVEVGAAVAGALRDLLGDLDLAGRRILDFGCGSGRILRHFAGEAGHAEFHGCDIDEASIAWLREHMCPPFHAHLTRAEAPLPFEDASFDVVWATSVFTHLGASWAHWLAELHRVVKPDGVAIVSILSAGYYEHLADEPWDADRVGMIVLGPGQPWHAGGPMVLHSPWWIRAHWGRAFEISELRTEAFVPGLYTPGGSQGVVVMRPRPGHVTPAELEAPEPDEPRELLATRHALQLLERDTIVLNRRHDEYAAAYVAEQARAAALSAELTSVRGLARALGRLVRSRVRQLTR
jgi:SAM-dependent methyltransferase